MAFVAVIVASISWLILQLCNRAVQEQQGKIAVFLASIAGRVHPDPEKREEFETVVRERSRSAPATQILHGCSLLCLTISLRVGEGVSRFVARHSDRIMVLAVALVISWIAPLLPGWAPWVWVPLIVLLTILYLLMGLVDVLRDLGKLPPADPGESQPQ